MAVVLRQQYWSERKFPILLSLPLGTEMFHFPRCASVIRQITALQQWGFPIRTFPVITVDCHLTGTFRRHSTSFIALLSLGIHHTLFHSCKEYCTPLARYVVFTYVDFLYTAVQFFWVCCFSCMKIRHARDTVCLMCVEDEKTLYDLYIILTLHTTYVHVAIL